MNRDFVNFIIYRQTFKELRKVIQELIEKLSEYKCCRIDPYSFWPELQINDFISIVFRSGPGERLGGLIVDYYNTDDSDEFVEIMLEQSAAKCSGKKVKSIDELVDYIVAEIIAPMIRSKR